MAVSPQNTRTSPLPLLGLTACFFATGGLAFILALVGGALRIPSLAASGFRSAGGLILAHALVLGWATSIAMGASYQITQVILRVPLHSRPLGFFHYTAHTLGVLVLIAGFSGHPAWIPWGGALVGMGILLFGWNLFATYARSQAINPLILGAGWSWLNLTITALLGIQMGRVLAGDAGGGNFSMWFHLHLLFGVGGWLSGLILTYSFKLLPMFFVSPKLSEPEAYTSVAAYHAGIWLFGGGILCSNAVLRDAGALGMLVGLAVLVYFAWRVRRLGNSKQHVGTMTVVWAQLPFMLFASLGCLALAVSRASELSGRAGAALMLAAILAWFSTTILGYLSRIVPFLWWAYRFRTAWGKKPKLLLDEMTPNRRLTVELAAYSGGAWLTVIGYAGDWPGLMAAAAALCGAAGIVYLAELSRTLRH